MLDIHQVEILCLPEMLTYSIIQNSTFEQTELKNSKYKKNKKKYTLSCSFIFVD